MTYPFYFKVKAINCFAEGSPSEYFTGLGLATSFTDATEQIEDAFGNELLSIERLELTEENKLLFLPEQYCTEYINSFCPSEEFKQIIPQEDN